MQHYIIFPLLILNGIVNDHIFDPRIIHNTETVNAVKSMKHGCKSMVLTPGGFDQGNFQSRATFQTTWKQQQQNTTLT